MLSCLFLTLTSSTPALSDAQTRRFQKPPTDSEVGLPGPGQYTTTTVPQYSYSISNSVSKNFRQNIASLESDMYPHKRTPGPASYEILQASKVLLRKSVDECGAAYVFKSRTRKSEINNAESTPGRDAPPPGAYNIPEEKNPRAGATAAFKTTSRDKKLSVRVTCLFRCNSQLQTAFGHKRWGIFDFFSSTSNEHHDKVYTDQGNKANLGHEVLAGAAGFEALRIIEQKHMQAAGTKPKDHFDELLAGIAAAEVDKLVETHSLRSKGFDDEKIESLKASATIEAKKGFLAQYGTD
ncbi:hypothetical protein HDU82_007149 [Entophlyctis luteolus]|nr:hypothetical protein HDU82_007149 [Entophlyctis luteolus]